MQYHDYRHEDCDYVDEACGCMVQDDTLFSVLIQAGKGENMCESKKLAWLEEQSSRYLNVPAVARRLDPLRGSYERTYDEGGGLANCVERPELYPHREGLFGFQ